MGQSSSKNLSPAYYFYTSDTGHPPIKGTPNSAGWDLYASEKETICPGTRKWIDTGIGIVLPESVYARVTGRSGLAGKGIDVGAGVIDGDYQGTLKVLIINNSATDFDVKQGDRIAQLILTRYLNQPCFGLIERPTKKTVRGDQGFGSTDKKQ